MSHNQLELSVYAVLVVVIIALFYSGPSKADNTYCNTYGNVTTCETYNNQGFTGRQDTTYNYNPSRTNDGTSSVTQQNSGFTQPMANETY